MDAHFALFNESVSDYSYFAIPTAKPTAEDRILAEVESQILLLKKRTQLLEGLLCAMPERQKAFSEIARLQTQFRRLKELPH